MILKGVIVVITPLTFCFKLLNVWSLQQANQRFALTAMQEKVAIYNLRLFFSLFQLFTIKSSPKKQKGDKTTLWLLKTPFIFEMKLTCFQKKVQLPSCFVRGGFC